MSYCWYCHWGWAKPVVAIYREAVRRLDGDDSPLDFGPSHIVWSDENFEDRHIKSCLKYCDKESDYSEDTIAIIRWSLEELLKIPEEERCIEPEDYDGIHPELYPPSVEVERIGG